ncbi:MAG: hypothetical protein BM562_17595 [Alphaproteobacteria bacterium MedPE-SWcel]|nr:MAG: hypothetical protein BM562_17595 [Alphaproteobacteria bacterium MedPE-SWcel]
MSESNASCLMSGMPAIAAEAAPLIVVFRQVCDIPAPDPPLGAIHTLRSRRGCSCRLRRRSTPAEPGKQDSRSQQ